ncbi:MAG: helix-turn-helix transcriptional regulator [Burkholderiaceae bacterium]|nr:helix-turn-helix transcriptional regulator [Burkholderiaceae bacterium]
MLTSRDLLAAVRVAHGIESNYRLARVLDVPEKSVQRWNSGKHTPDDAMAVRLADMAGLDAAEVLAAMHAQRCNDDALRSIWQTVAERSKAVAAALVAAILSGFITGTPDAQARATTADFAQSPARPAIDLTMHRRGFCGPDRPERNCVPDQ